MSMSSRSEQLKRASAEGIILDHLDGCDRHDCYQSHYHVHLLRHNLWVTIPGCHGGSVAQELYELISRTFHVALMSRKELKDLITDRQEEYNSWANRGFYGPDPIWKHLVPAFQAGWGGMTFFCLRDVIPQIPKRYRVICAVCRKLVLTHRRVDILTRVQEQYGRHFRRRTIDDILDAFGLSDLPFTCSSRCEYEVHQRVWRENAAFRREQKELEKERKAWADGKNKLKRIRQMLAHPHRIV